jgi:hypothetical protein
MRIVHKVTALTHLYGLKHLQTSGMYSTYHHWLGRNIIHAHTHRHEEQRHVATQYGTISS